MALSEVVWLSLPKGPLRIYAAFTREPLDVWSVEGWLRAHPAEGSGFAGSDAVVRSHARLTEYELAGASPADVSELFPVATSLRRAKGAEQLALSQLFAAPFGHGHVLEYELGAAARLQPPTSPPLADEPSPWMQPLGYTALTAALLGGALSTAALVTYLDGRDATQIEAIRANRNIERFHQLSLIPYAAAAAAGLTWVWLKLDSEDDTKMSVRPLPSVGDGAAFLGIDGQF